MISISNEFIFQILACISVLFSGAIVVTTSLFRDFGQKYTVQIIFYMSFCDMCGAIVSILGFPANGTISCTVQAIFVSFFYRASWIWTTFLTYQINHLIKYRRFALTMHKMHLITWLTTGLATFLPLSTSSFGRPEQAYVSSYHHGWCFLTNNSDQSELAVVIWSFVTVQGLMWIALLIMGYFLFDVYRHYSNIRMKEFAKIRAAVDFLIAYPFVLFISWFLLGFAFIIFPHISQATVAQVNYAAFLVATQSGTLMSVVFFTKSHEARARWGHLLSTFSFSSNTTATTTSSPHNQNNNMGDPVDPDYDLYTGHSFAAQEVNISHANSTPNDDEIGKLSDFDVESDEGDNARPETVNPDMANSSESMLSQDDILSAVDNPMNLDCRPSGMSSLENESFS